MVYRPSVCMQMDLKLYSCSIVLLIDIMYRPIVCACRRILSYIVAV